MMTKNALRAFLILRKTSLANKRKPHQSDLEVNNSRGNKVKQQNRIQLM